MAKPRHCPECGHDRFSWGDRQSEDGAIIEDDSLSQERDDREDPIVTQTKSETLTLTDD